METGQTLEFEFIGVKQEQSEEPEDVGVKQEPLEDQDNGEFLPQEEEQVTPKRDLPEAARDAAAPEAFEFVGVKQEPLEEPEDDEFLPQVAPCVPAGDDPVTDPLAAEGEAITDSNGEKCYTTGRSHTSGENGLVSPGDVDHYRPTLATARSGGPRSCQSAGPEPMRRVFRCDSCSAIFSSKYHLVNHVFTHIAEVPPPSHVCRWCAEVFRNTASLIKHSKGHENGPEVPAVLSEQSEGSGRSVGGKKRHGVRKPLVTEPQVCDLCGEAFPSLGNLNLHVRTHSGERPHTCDVCGKAFMRSVHLQNHKLTHTAEKRHYCEFCGRAFSRRHNLKVHVRIHTGENPYSCEVCGASFHVFDQLKMHRHVHTGRKPYECDECGNFYVDANSLRRHKRKHSGEKPYSCDVCGEAFMWSATLQKHKRLHTGEKPFQCDLCSGTFAEMGILNRHMRIHTRQRPYACDICGASFSAWNILKRHRHKLHENRVVLDV